MLLRLGRAGKPGSKAAGKDEGESLPVRIEDAVILAMSSGLYREWAIVNCCAGGRLPLEARADGTSSVNLENEAQTGCS